MSEEKEKKLRGKFKNIHGDKYRYKFTDGLRYKDRMEVYCVIHKKYFTQQIRNHLDGKGCYDCGRESRTLTREEVISKIEEIHQGKYGFDRLQYLGSVYKVELYCNTHKEYFWILPHALFAGSGCYKCGIETSIKKNTLTQEEVIKRFIEIHGDTYGYDRVTYINMDTKVEMYCKVHNEYFFQTPSNHLKGQGCKKCGHVSSGKVQQKTTEQIIEEFIRVHGDRYGYDKVIYINAYTKVTIYCKVHKKYFEQTPSMHLLGQGCPICNESKGERMVAKCLSELGLNVIREYKVSENPYEYDFYLPDHNVFIEYHGEHHYKFNKFFHKTTARFEERKLCDAFKIEIVKAWHGKLITIDYTVDTQEKVNEFLIKKLIFLRVISSTSIRAERKGCENIS